MISRQRAEPLARDERRAAILGAVIPLLLEDGSVTTARMAEAAGVAEGTIFRVFDDKATVLHEAIKTCLDPAPVLHSLSTIERDLPFPLRLRKAAAIILKRAERVHALAAVLRSMPPSDHTPDHQDTHRTAVEANSMIFWGLTRMFRDEADQLAVTPEEAAAAFRGLLFAVSSPFVDPDEELSADQAIDVLLGGILDREAGR